MWLTQGIIRPSESPYASQVVIVRKMNGEIQLCVNYWKLNFTVVRDAFPLPCIDEALQAVDNCQWFMCFDLAKGYLQMHVEQANIQKTAFRAGLSGLYEFTHMPFGLSNSGSSFLLPHGDVSRRSTICNTPIVPRQHLCICHQHR